MAPTLRVSALMYALFGLTAVIPHVGEAQTAAEGQLRYAGVGFLAPRFDLPLSFPRLWAADSAARSNHTSPDRTLFALVQASNPNSELSTDLASQIGSGLVFAWDDDETSLERFQVPGRQNDILKFAFRAGGQLLIVDLAGGKQVIASIPVSTEYISVVDSPPSTMEIASLVEGLLNRSDSASPLAQAAWAFPMLHRALGATCRMQVVEVNADSLYPLLPKGYSGQQGSLERWIASELGSSWVSALGIPVLPSTGSQAVEGRLTLRFSDSRVFDLTVPDPDFVIRLTRLRGRRVTSGRSAGGESLLFGVLGRLEVIEPVSGRAMLSLDVKDWVTKIVPSTQTQVDAWGATAEALRSLVAGVSMALARSDESWFSLHGTSPASRAASHSLNEVKSRCGVR